MSGEYQKNNLEKFWFQKERKLESPILLGIFLSINILTFSLSIYVLPACNPWYSVYGMDSWGNLCSSLTHTPTSVPNVLGSGKNMFGKDFVWSLGFYANTTDCLYRQSFNSHLMVKICVESCPTLNLKMNNGCLTILKDNDYLSTEYEYAQEKCNYLENLKSCQNKSTGENESNVTYVLINFCKAYIVCGNE